MEDNICRESVIKINWYKDTYHDDNYIRKFNDTNLPLNGIYEDEKGVIRYFKNGKYHNANGPSFIEKDGYKQYRINNKLHRIDGPAVIYPNPKVYSWYINDYNIDGKRMDKWLKENDIPLDYKTWTDSDKMLFALHWSDYVE